MESGAVSIERCRLTNIGIPVFKIRRSRDRLIFNMGIPIPGKDSLHIDTGPWWPYQLIFAVVEGHLLLTLDYSVTSLYSNLHTKMVVKQKGTSVANVCNKLKHMCCISTLLYWHKHHSFIPICRYLTILIHIKLMVLILITKWVI